VSAVSFASVRNRPGVSTVWLLTSVALRAAGREVVAVEADPDGNDLATTYDLGQSPGLVSLAAAARRGASSVGVVDEHARHLPDGLAVVPGPVAAEDATAAVTSIASRIAGLVAADRRLWCCDLGRLGAGSPALPIAVGSAYTVLVCRPTRTEALALPSRVATLSSAGCRLGLVVVGKGPYRPAEVAAHAGVELVGSMPWARDAEDLVAAAVADRRGRRSLLWRAAVEIAGVVVQWVDWTAAQAGSEPAPVVAGGLR
jgi:hypothetical protein